MTGHLLLTIALIAQDLSKITAKSASLETQLEGLTVAVVGISALLFLLFKSHKSPSIEALGQRFTTILSGAFFAGLIAGGVVKLVFDFGKSVIQ